MFFHHPSQLHPSWKVGKSKCNGINSLRSLEGTAERGRVLPAKPKKETLCCFSVVISSEAGGNIFLLNR